MGSRNPLIEAPHVPKLDAGPHPPRRAPEWGQFVDSRPPVSTAGARPRGSFGASAWSQAPSNPYTTPCNDRGVPRGQHQQQGPLQPAWMQVEQQPSQQPQHKQPGAGQAPTQHHHRHQPPSQTAAAMPPLSSAHRSFCSDHQAQLAGDGSTLTPEYPAAAGLQLTPGHGLPHNNKGQSQWPSQQQQQHQHQQLKQYQQQVKQQGEPADSWRTQQHKARANAAQQPQQQSAQRPWSAQPHRQQQQQQVASGPSPLQQQQQQVASSSRAIKPAWDLNDEDDVMLPSCLWDGDREGLGGTAGSSSGAQQQQRQHQQQQQPGQAFTALRTDLQQQLPQHQRQQQQPSTQQWQPRSHGQTAASKLQAAQQDRQQQQWQYMQAGPLLPPKQQQQQAHLQPAAASLWSRGVDVVSLKSSAPQKQPQKQGGQEDRTQGAKAAAGAGAAPAASNKQGSSKQGSSKAKGGQRSKAKGASKGTSSSSSLVMEIVPRQPGDTAAQQPKLHQSTLFDTLKRAQRNKQQEHQASGIEQDESHEQDDALGSGKQQVQVQEGGVPSGKAGAKQPAARKRKHSAVAAAAAAPRASGGSSGVASGGGRRAAASGGNKRARLSKAAAAALEGAVEVLDMTTLSNNSSSTTVQEGQQQQQGSAMRDATVAGSAAWQQLQQELAAAEGVVLGLLLSKVVCSPTDGAPLAAQYYTSMQRPYKQQQVLLTKAAGAARKQAASSVAAAADSSSVAAEAGAEGGQEAADAAGVEQLVGVALLPVARQQGASAARTQAASATSCSYLVHLWQGQQGAGQQALPPHVLQLLQAVLCDPAKRPCVCCAAKAVLCALSEQGLLLPAAHTVSLIDPELLGWLLDPQLIQDTKQDACYTLQQQLSRSGMQVPAIEAMGPLQRLHHQLQLSLQLATHLHTQLRGPGGVAGQAIKLEMQVAALLAKMESAGVACKPAVLSDHRPTLADRLAAIKARAAQLVGYEFNLSSSSQLAKVLYEDLRLTPPAAGGGRGAAKTHLSTNEAALKQLAMSHELPGLVLEHRCIMNVMSKWIDAQWVAKAAQAPGGRVYCAWQQTSTATGRLSSCSPNMQAVTRYTVTAQDAGASGAAAGAQQDNTLSLLTINVRDAFVAPPGKLLLSADYSQIELRLLAHFSEDKLLRQILSQSTGDVFNMIAAALQHAGTRQGAWLTAPNSGQGVTQALPEVSPEERERAKRVVYGIIYGQTPWGLAQQLADQGVSTAAAQSMIDSFLARFPGVRQFMSRAINAAQANGAVSTLMGRRRPIPGLRGDFQERAAAERKVVNTQVQGSAADLIKLAMCAWEQWVSQQQPAPAQLIAQIHDELLFEVAAPDAQLEPDGSVQHPGQQFMQVAAAVARLMESAAPLTVPLRVKLAWGQSWGALSSLQL